jgi:hypothetical protein
MPLDGIPVDHTTGQSAFSLASGRVNVSFLIYAGAVSILNPQLLDPVLKKSNFGG